MLVLPATSTYLHAPFHVSNRIINQWVSSTLILRKKHKFVHTNPLILQILLNQSAVVSIILLASFSMDILIPKS